MRPNALLALRPCFLRALPLTTGVLLCLLLFHSSAFAQGPGGPGGDGPTGWIALPNPTYPDLYDWTGLTVHYTGVDYQRNYSEYTTQVYKQVDDVGSVGGSTYADRTWTMSASGTSTYKWLWQPPSTPLSSGAPDYQTFPLPPLFVLGIVNTASAEMPTRTIWSASPAPGRYPTVSAQGGIRASTACRESRPLEQLSRRSCLRVIRAYFRVGRF